MLYVDVYWVGQNVHLSFSYDVMGKHKQTFWPTQYKHRIMPKRKYICRNTYIIYIYTHTHTHTHTHIHVSTPTEILSFSTNALR